MYHAWIIPGIHPSIQRQILIQKSAVQPRLKNTVKGGRKIARKYRHTSLVEETLSAIWRVDVWSESSRIGLRLQDK
ncbi:hypothetical protein PILCRDRAFT_826579 [Piloderma croceum F 1598]|uniref:Uncharacterized protein n=1 Tax=Piloderma croceum (strain F 1598) TaxID=765440 RepID=A0A0C3F943_PILCF|nr:hypothetical protein PILCRDRAFT_826579 [Piloderma croceum F 1598]